MWRSLVLPKSYHSVLTLYSLPHFDGHRIGKACAESADAGGCAAAEGDGHGMAIRSGRLESSSSPAPGCAVAECDGCGTATGVGRLESLLPPGCAVTEGDGHRIVVRSGRVEPSLPCATPSSDSPVSACAGWADGLGAVAAASCGQISTVETCSASNVGD